MRSRSLRSCRCLRPPLGLPSSARPASARSARASGPTRARRPMSRTGTERLVRSARAVRCRTAAQPAFPRPAGPALRSAASPLGGVSAILPRRCCAGVTAARTLRVLRRGPEADASPFSRMDPTAPAGDRSARSNPMTRTAFIIATALSIWACEALAADYNVGSIAIGNPWTRATPKGATVAGAYMSISNKGSAPDRLVGGSAAVAGHFEVHSMVMEQGVAKMRPVEGGLEIKPGETVELKPGGFHVMLTGLKQPLQKGAKVKGTLEFEKAGKVEIEYAVEALGATAPAAGGHQH